MDWQEIAVTVTPEGEEAVADLFYQLGCPGVSIDDLDLLADYIESGMWDYHAFGEVDVTGTSVVKGYFREDDELPDKLQALEAGLLALLERFPSWGLQVQGLTVQDQDWEMAWQAYYKPQRWGRFVICPTWETIEPKPEDLVLELDPGMAFGTGAHPTTRLCLKALEATVRPGMRVFDIGTGSGILAIAAAKLGAEVEAVDLDEAAVVIAQENVARNHVQDRVRVSRSDLAVSLTGQADVIIGNLVADVILALIPDLARVGKPSGYVIVSGVIEGRQDEVAEAFGQAGFRLITQEEEASWFCFCTRADRGGE
ncbi:MAG: 50S ribosomal protein L11 methyltransferase [Peptococcaceae bacterium]|jgi:ribosomal protein L11 methyltransferase|nr:50S ribosomal protein L11 methyltransferase [Peptococcaceae bacterium]